MYAIRSYYGTIGPDQPQVGVPDGQGIGDAVEDGFELVTELPITYLALFQLLFRPAPLQFRRGAGGENA